MQERTLRKIVSALVDDFGYEAVHTSLESCRADARTIEDAKRSTSVISSKSRLRMSAPAFVETLKIVDEGKKDVLLVLAKEYEEKKLMPNIKSVRAFLTQKGQDASGVKSRQQAVAVVFKCLATWEIQELCEFHKKGAYAGPKSLSVIAKSIEHVGQQNRI